MAQEYPCATRAQDVAEVLNLDYLPVTNDNVNLLKEEKKFMRAVFAKTLQIDRGKKCVR